MKSLRQMFVLVSLLVFVTGANAKPDQGNQGQYGQPQDNRGQNDHKNRGQGRPQRQAPPQQAQQQQRPQQQRPPQDRGQQRGQQQQQWQQQQRQQQQQQRPQYAPRNGRVDRQPVRVDDRSYRRPGRVDRQPVGGVVDRSRIVDRPRVTTPIVRGRTTPTRVESRSTFWPRFRATNWSSQHRTWVQRGGYRGYRVPTTRFNLYFGRRHHFRLSSFTVRLYDNEPAFYSYGYWVMLLDPVPEYWDPDWYDVDYVRIVQLEDGYYLLNESDPDVLLAVDIRRG
jgi:hypothetical protein